MSLAPDIIIIGAGPAGMAAAQVAAEHGADTLVLDEQGAPGGQIYRAIEANENLNRPELGKSYRDGLSLTRSFRDCNARYIPQASLWQLSADREVGYSTGGAAHLVTARKVILATGAQERPFPVPGWTLPGVMTIGAAQILLKESQICIENAVFAGTGPLFYLVIQQYLAAGVPVKAVIDLTPGQNYLAALRHLPQALPELSRIIEGWRWKRQIVKSGVPYITGVDDLRIIGGEAATAIEYRKNGHWQQISCSHVLLHQGVVPNVNAAMAAGCASSWSPAQCCWTIDVDNWFRSSINGIFVAGDGSSIGGALAAEHRGRIAALGALTELGTIDEAARNRLARPHQRRLKSEMRLRPFLDALFRPADRYRIPQDDQTIVCRCEEITVGQIREAVAVGLAGPNQLKSFSRCGMGPCQGRFCGLTVSEMIAEINGEPVGDVGYFRLRPPLKPLLLDELANLTVPPEE